MFLPPRPFGLQVVHVPAYRCRFRRPDDMPDDAPDIKYSRKRHFTTFSDHRGVTHVAERVAFYDGEYTTMFQ